jgi:hypothetical protein
MSDEIARLHAFTLELAERIFVCYEIFSRFADDGGPPKRRSTMEPARFKIGDFVVSKAQMKAIDVHHKLRPATNEKDWLNTNKEPIPCVFQVVEILEQTCYGGFKRHYDCRGVGPESVMTSLMRFVEIELDAAPE